MRYKCSTCQQKSKLKTCVITDYVITASIPNILASSDCAFLIHFHSDMFLPFSIALPESLVVAVADWIFMKSIKNLIYTIPSYTKASYKQHSHFNQTECKEKTPGLCCKCTAGHFCPFFKGYFLLSSWSCHTSMCFPKSREALLYSNHHMHFKGGFCLFVNFFFHSFKVSVKSETFVNCGISED